MYDFIVVGAGPAGASLAATLAKSKKAPAVLLLEGGPAKDPANPDILAERWTSFFQYPASNYGYETEPQKHLNNRVVNYSRGKGLGGSTIINMCAWTVGPKDDWDRWANEVGDKAFNWESSVRQRRKIESYGNYQNDEYRNNIRPDMATHGTDGAVRIEYPKVWEAPQYVAFNGGKECNFELNLDSNNGNPLGLGSVPSTAKNGRRVDAADAWLSDPPANLTIETNAPVTKVLFNGNKAIGVLVNGREYKASKEVILSAGAVDSPKILMLSGVGDKEELAAHGIDSHFHLPGVGKNLQDHLMAPTGWRLKDGAREWPKLYTDPEKLKAAYAQFAKDGTGPLSVFFQGLVFGFFKADDVFKTPEFADLPKAIQTQLRQPTVPIWEMSAHIPPFSPDADPNASFLTVVGFLHNPQSRGTITLASADPTVPPRIDPNFFSHPFDRACAIEATKGMLKFVGTPCMQRDIVAPFVVPASDKPEDVLAHWAETGGSTWHPSCTVKMGHDGDELACLDSDFRVRGLEGLRVADMSATPYVPSYENS